MRRALPLWSTLVAAMSVARAAPLGLAYQLTYSINDSPSPSPDGRRWVYVSVVAGHSQLFIMNADGSRRTQLTRDDFDHDDPAWSPDGTLIAFTSGRDGGEAIAIVRADGTGLQTLTPPSQRMIHPSWSPDGRALVYCSDDDLKPPHKNDSDIWRLELATRHAARLVTGGVNTYPSYSPDGKRLAFRRMIGEMNSEVFVAEADGSGAHNVTNHPAFDGWPAWSPDGREIAFASNRNSSYQVFVMSADGADVRLVANTEGRATSPRWSPDGSRLYFPISRRLDFGVTCEIFVAGVRPPIR